MEYAPWEFVLEVIIFSIFLVRRGVYYTLRGNIIVEYLAHFATIWPVNGAVAHKGKGRIVKKYLVCCGIV